MGGHKDCGVIELRSAYERLSKAGRHLRGGAETALGLKDHSEREAAFSALEHWCREWDDAVKLAKLDAGGTGA